MASCTLTYLEQTAAQDFQVLRWSILWYPDELCGMPYIRAESRLENRWRLYFQSLNSVEAVQQWKQSLSFEESPLLYDLKNVVYHQVILTGKKNDG
jgi:hypothetical protein